MCGINGIIDYSAPGKNYGPEIISMNNCLSHRGPDDQGTYMDSFVNLGHKRLSIIDTSSGGHQPMFDGSGRYAIIFNGEIYNYAELKRYIDYPFKTNSDTEVLIAAYIKWGANCLHFLRGMFVFAIWDNVEKSLFIARDRLGVKPLYYTHKDKVLIFSSEIRPILASGLTARRTSAGTVTDFLRFQTIFAPSTLIDEINYLPPGSYIKFDRSGFGITTWWDAENFIDNRKISKTEAIEETGRLLSRAVEERLVADVPFGAFLSGGIDSSIVVALMAKYATGPVKTFSVIFSEKQFSEEKYSRIIAKKYNTDHQEILLTPEAFLEKVPRAINALDHPSGDGPNTYIISEATAKSGIKMALSGLGGDELFAGYHYFNTARTIETSKGWLNLIPPGVMQALVGAEQVIKRNGAIRKLSDVLSTGELANFNYYPFVRKVWVENDLKHILARYSPSGKMFPEVKNLKGDNMIAGISFSELKYYLQHILLRDTDQMSMAHGLEVRVPFLAHDLVEFMLGIKDRWKTGPYPKQLLIDTFRDDLPREVYDRPKMGFTLPWEHWLRNELYSYCEARLVNLGDRNLFNKKEMLAYWTKFKKGNNQISWSRWWLLVVLENWLSTNKIELD